jgi:Putative DNA-binding domain
MQVRSLGVGLSRPDEVLATLAAEKPSGLIGTPESAQIDFKAMAYQLSTPKGKWELAKDVAGLANLSGGVLVVGVRTTKTEGNFQEIASELRPVSVAMLDRVQHHDVIRDLVRPAVDFDVEYFPDPDTTGKGYMTIHVKPLAEADRYALVRRMIAEDGKEIDAIGVPVRDSDQTRWLSADEAYRLLRDGQRSNSLPRAQAEVSPGSDNLNWEEALERLIELKDWDAPLLVWQSMPLEPVDFLFRMWGKDSISQILANPPSLRANGFNWNFYNGVQQFDGGALASDGRRAIWVAPNGLITAAAVANEEMLAWAMHNHPDQPQRLNALAVVEITLEYFRLVDEYILPGTEKQFKHSIATRKFANEPPVVLPEGLPNFVSSFSGRSVSADTRHQFDQYIPANAERDAYGALWRLYATFQLGPDRVPFNDNGRIDSSKLLDWTKTHH